MPIGNSAQKKEAVAKLLTPSDSNQSTESRLLALLWDTRSRQGKKKQLFNSSESVLTLQCVVLVIYNTSLHVHRFPSFFPTGRCHNQHFDHEVTNTVQQISLFIKHNQVRSLNS